MIESYDNMGHFCMKERRGYAQERKKVDGVDMMFIMDGGDSGMGRWVPASKVEITKGKWTNKTNKIISKKSFWRRAK
jgi:hypothetical protein|tara:strand:- start:74 stop:304 length:231 start_codon:yes stop_codon:yes gene_type:complete